MCILYPIAYLSQTKKIYFIFVGKFYLFKLDVIINCKNFIFNLGGFSMKKKLSTGNKVLIGILSFILLIFASAGVYAGYLSSKVNRVEIDRSDVTNTGKETPDDVNKASEDVTTIALFASDFSDENGNNFGASDSTMILSIDTKNKKIKLCSLMRDMYLDLPGGGKQNLNYTMLDGGPSSIMKVINYNFNLKIDKFIHVSLRTLPAIIDKLGGVELNITDEELNFINSYIAGIDKENGTNTPKLTSSGKQLLNGTQASAYCRIRYTEGRDYKRTERQRTVLTALFNKFKNINITEIPGLVSEVLPYVSTNLTNTEIISIATEALKMNIGNIEQGRFPEDSDHTTEWTDMYHMIVDIPTTTKKIHKFIYSLE